MAKSLDQVNDQLATRDLCVMRQANGKFAVLRINRGAHPAGYDTLTRRPGKGFDTVEQALASLED